MIFNNMDFTGEAENDKLYMAILTNDDAEIERLRTNGVTLSEHIKGMLKNGGRDPEKKDKRSDDWFNFTDILDDYAPEEFISVLRNLHAELGEPIYFSDTYGLTVLQYPRPDVFRCVLDCFDNKKIPKKSGICCILLTAI